MIWKKSSLCLKASIEAQKENIQTKKKEKQRIKICNMKTQMKKAEVKMILKEMIFLFITIDMLLNRVSYTHILVDLRCLCFGMMTKKTVKQNKLKQFPVSSWQVIGVMGKSGTINEITKAHIDINEHTEICYFYIKNNNLKYNLIFDRLWLNRNDVQVIVKEKTIYFSFTSLYVKSTEGQLKKITLNIHEINDAVYAN